MGDESYAIEFHPAVEETVYFVYVRTGSWTNVIAVKGTGTVDLATAIEYAKTQFTRIH